MLTKFDKDDLEGKLQLISADQCQVVYIHAKCTTYPISPDQAKVKCGENYRHYMQDPSTVSQTFMLYYLFAFLLP